MKFSLESAGVGAKPAPPLSMSVPDPSRMRDASDASWMGSSCPGEEPCFDEDIKSWRQSREEARESDLDLEAMSIFTPNSAPSDGEDGGSKRTRGQSVGNMDDMMKSFYFDGAAKSRPQKRCSAGGAASLAPTSGFSKATLHQTKGMATAQLSSSTPVRSHMSGSMPAITINLPPLVLGGDSPGPADFSAAKQMQTPLARVKQQHAADSSPTPSDSSFDEHNLSDPRISDLGADMFDLEM